MKHTVEWIDRGREPQCPPNPAYPNGKPLRLTDIVKAKVKHCRVDLPYPAKRCGIYRVECKQCRLSVGVTTAGRPDDPTYLEMACGRTQHCNSRRWEWSRTSKKARSTLAAPP